MARVVIFSADALSKSIRRPFRKPLESLPGLAIVAYFSGWNYASEYFSAFDINRSSFQFHDYTVFLYSFFVITKLHLVAIACTIESHFAVLSIVGMFVCLTTTFRTLAHSLLPIIRCTLAIVLGVVFVYLASTEAGRISAERVYRGSARQIDITLTPQFYSALRHQHGEAYAQAQKDDIADANHNDALALIWRDREETVILQYDTTQGASHGEPVVVYRIPNEYIALLETKREVE